MVVKEYIKIGGHKKTSRYTNLQDEQYATTLKQQAADKERF